jgi:hypothetical protein
MLLSRYVSATTMAAMSNIGTVSSASRATPRHFASSHARRARPSGQTSTSSRATGNAGTVGFDNIASMKHAATSAYRATVGRCA